MKTLVKAALSASALLAAGQANAATYIFGANSTVDANFYQNFGSTAAGIIGGVLAGSSTGAAGSTFSDTFIFAVPWPAALGGGSATASQYSFNLDFDHMLTDATGLVLTGYNLTGAGATALQNLYAGMGSASDLSTVMSLINSGNVDQAPIDGIYDLTGTTARVHLDNVALNSSTVYTFTISGTVNGSSGGSYGGQFTASAVPEPATWAMLLVGFGAVGFAMRRRNEQRVKVSFA